MQFVKRFAACLMAGILTRLQAGQLQNLGATGKRPEIFLVQNVPTSPLFNGNVGLLHRHDAAH
jgi:hypothetical protein